MPTRPSSAKPPRLAPSLPRATVCAAINQLATPGLGTLMAGRRWPGYGQLAFAVTGFGLILNWMVRHFTDMIRLQMGLGPLFTDSEWMARWGGWAFAAGWLWALFSSVSLLRATHQNPGAAQDRKPPVLPGAGPGTTAA